MATSNKFHALTDPDYDLKTAQIEAWKKGPEAEAEFKRTLTKEQREKLYGPDRSWYNPIRWFVGYGRRTQRKKHNMRKRTMRKRTMRNRKRRV